MFKSINTEKPKKKLLILIVPLTFLFLTVAFLGEGCKPALEERSLSPKAREGKAIYQREECYRCHRIKGRGERTGPDLTRVGKKYPEKEWYFRYFKNPQAVISDSAMPKPRLNKEEIEKLTEYMRSLK